MANVYDEQFNTKVLTNYMDYLIPYGEIVFYKSENMKQEKYQAFIQAQEIMNCVNEVNKSLTTGSWSPECIEYLNRFSRPLDVAIRAYAELQKERNGERPSMDDVMQRLCDKANVPKNPEVVIFNNPFSTKQIIKEGKQKKPTLHEKIKDAKEKVREADAAKPDKDSKAKPKRDERE